jgi:hypothetical protein
MSRKSKQKSKKSKKKSRNPKQKKNRNFCLDFGVFCGRISVIFVCFSIFVYLGFRDSSQKKQNKVFVWIS